MIIRKEKVSIHNLQVIYSTIHKLIKDKDIYYSTEELEKLKKDKNNIFIEIKEVWNGSKKTYTCTSTF